MAAPSYTQDLTDITLAESTTGWSAYGGGASGLDQNPDSSMQGTYGVGKQISSADKGQYYDNGSGITLGTGDHVYVWLFNTTPGLCDTRQNKGVSILLGTSSSAYCQYHVEGNDTYGAAGRVGKCYPIDYSVRSATGSPPYRSVTGSAGANPQIFGGGLVTTATVKGFNCVIDAIRYGTGAYLTAGELISAGDASDNPCTFSGFASQNDSVSNRWGILTSVAGSYELQGMFAIGQNNSGTATLARFQDNDKNIVFVDTPHAASNFTQVVVDHASTVCNLTNINFTALGTTNPGLFTVNSSNPTVNITGGTWTGMNTILFRSNTTVDGLTVRNCYLVNTNGATISNSTFENLSYTSHMVVPSVADIESVTDCTFISDGTGYGISVSNTVSSNTTINWANFLENYAGTSGSTGNEAIAVNVASGITLTINVDSGYSTPSINNIGAGTVNVVTGAVPVSVTVLDTSNNPIQNVQTAVYKTSDRSEILNADTNASGVASTTFTGTTPVEVEVRCRKASSGATKYINYSSIQSIGASGLSLLVTLREDTNNNATS